MESTEFAHKIVDMLSDRKGVDTILLDVRQVSLLADYFVITSGEVDRHLQGMADEVSREFKQAGIYPLHVEGKADSGWILMDYGDVVIHLFSTQMRDYYRFEELWKEARVVVRVQ